MALSILFMGHEHGPAVRGRQSSFGEPVQSGRFFSHLFMSAFFNGTWPHAHDPTPAPQPRTRAHPGPGRRHPSPTDPTPTARRRPARRSCGDQLTTTAAGLLLVHYTRHDDLVIDLTADPTITAAAIDLDRRISHRLTLSERRPRADADLTPPPAAPRRAALVLDQAPSGLHRIDGLQRITEWIRVRHAVLARPGVLVLRVDSPIVDGQFTDPASGLVTAARACGLIYHQHLIAVTSPLREPTGEGAGTTPAPGQLIDGRHIRAHLDLYVFVTGGIDD